MNSSKNRAILLAIVGAYLIYTAWELFQGRNDPDTSMTPQLAVLFALLFVLAAGGVLFMAWRVWKRAGQEEEEPVKKDDPNSLK